MPETVHGQVRVWIFENGIALTDLQVVTGASDGIGREFALQLSKAGFSILLVARNQVALETLAKEIRALPSQASRLPNLISRN